MNRPIERDPTARPPGRREAYVAALDGLGSEPGPIETFLIANSNLPGPRGNLELAHAFADWAPSPLVDELAGSEDEFLGFCAVLALGERLSRRDDPVLVEVLLAHARDPRWRIREAVATGLQRVGDRDLARLCRLVRDWVHVDDPLVQRAAAAAICEPRLLQGPDGATAALDVCRAATDWLAGLPADRRREGDVRTLRQALGYCWSVAVAADPDCGLRAFEGLRSSVDPDVRWIVRENCRKARLQRVLAGRDGPGEEAGEPPPGP